MQEVLPWLQSQLQSRVKGKKTERIRQWLAVSLTNTPTQHSKRGIWQNSVGVLHHQLRFSNVSKLCAEWQLGSVYMVLSVIVTRIPCLSCCWVIHICCVSVNVVIEISESGYVSYVSKIPENQEKEYVNSCVSTHYWMHPLFLNFFQTFWYFHELKWTASASINSIIK